MRRFTKKSILIFCIGIGMLVSAAANEALELSSGFLKVMVYPKTGSFTLYRFDVCKKNYTPLYDSTRSGSVNVISLHFNRTVYPLIKKIGSTIFAEKIDNRIVMTFQISKDFKVTQTFYFIPGEKELGGQYLKIDISVHNLSENSVFAAFKALIDSSLGENKKRFLYTDTKRDITSEILLRLDTEKDATIVSSDVNAACLFLLKHPQAITPINVYAANRNRLTGPEWLPHYQQGRSFTKGNSVSDAAMLFIWKEKLLKKGSIMTVSMIVGCADYCLLTAQRIRDSITIAETESERIKKNYDYIQKLLQKIEKVEENPDIVSDEAIYDLTDQTDKAIKDIQE
ncbi:hypothetical protein [Treponema phagedenis]|uniref:hypothetical protein n=1 Tax=Treponema phagedenis TaxID=162 RepID=UPI0001F638EC|nr:hypothetical protein [Treponema phagedenis]EFW36566.1 hypothetical protein HMPREF9554_02972 [Treponema phagedenis F0421]TYT77909.1 hypothetical protein FS559_01595 [Treponema phagedenis]